MLKKLNCTQLALSTLALVCVAALIGLYWYGEPALPINVMVPVHTQQSALTLAASHSHPNHPLLSSKKQHALKAAFLKHYYQPWQHTDSTQRFCITADHKHCLNITVLQHQTIAQLIAHPGYNRNYVAHSRRWAYRIYRNMAMDSFPNSTQPQSARGIMVANAMLRAVPTAEPSYKSVDLPGEGYPFDTLQESAIWIGTPVHIVHRSKDKQWQLIKAAGLVGWVKTSQVAQVDTAFIHTWKKYPLGTSRVRKTELQITPNNKLPHTLYLGTLLPIKQHQLLIPQMGKHHNAKLSSLPLSQTAFQPWPLPPTPMRFAKTIDTILGMTYGWGDLDFNTDCSGTMRSLFTAFGIWLPRNSYSQAHYGGQLVRLPKSQHSVEARKNVFRHTGAQAPIPFLTLISFGGREGHIGHIGLYVGHDAKGHPILFQSAWGMVIENAHHKGTGRAIIGHAVLTQLGLGADIRLHNKWRSLNIRTLWEKPEFDLTFLQ